VSPLRVKAIAKKELIQIGRDPLSLLMAFFLPVILLLIFGYAITLDVDHITTVVYDQDKSIESRDLVAQFRESGYFTVVAFLERPEEIDGFLDSSLARVAIWVPAGFAKNIKAGRRAQVQVVLDGSDSNTATIAKDYVASIGMRYAQQAAGGLIVPAIDARPRLWYNPELKSRNFIVPGLIAVIMSVIVSILTSLTIAREWERGTMEQLIATPVKPSELITGKLIPYFLIGLVDTLMSIAMSVYLFEVPLRGSFFLLVALSCLFLFGGLSFGILISIVARTQLLASQMAMLSTFLPAFLLSGFMFTIANMPKPLQLFTYIVPARYFVAIVKGIYLKGNPLALIAGEAGLLAVFGLAVFAVANRKLVKRIG
jgi:ABC-2 type transport system permease protein